MKPNRSIPLLFLFYLLAACTPAKKPVVVSKKAAVNTADLGGSWRLVEISDAPLAMDELYPVKKPTIHFDVVALRATGNTGCNSFSGPIAVDGSQISFREPLTLTKMFCEGRGEPFFLESVKKITAWALIDASTLTLVAGDSVLMRLEKTP